MSWRVRSRVRPPDEAMLIDGLLLFVRFSRFAFAVGLLALGIRTKFRLLDGPEPVLQMSLSGLVCSLDIRSRQAGGWTSNGKGWKPGGSLCAQNGGCGHG